MKAARFYDRNDIRIEDIPAPEAAAGEVLPSMATPTRFPVRTPP